MNVEMLTPNLSTQQNQFMNIRERQPSQFNNSQSKEIYKTNQDVNKEDVQLAVDNVNDFLEPVSTNLKFVYHEELNDYYVTVIDPTTDEVIREIPPKKMLDMYVAMAEYMGFLVDEKV